MYSAASTRQETYIQRSVAVSKVQAHCWRDGPHIEPRPGIEPGHTGYDAAALPAELPGLVFLAEVPGLEPRLTEPESAGLPITPYPIARELFSDPRVTALTLPREAPGKDSQDGLASRVCAPSRARTEDPRIKSPLLCQLS